mgnify:CR=1 FL=1
MDDLPIVVEDTVEEMDGGGNHAPPAQREPTIGRWRGRRFAFAAFAALTFFIGLISF